jgi:type IV secretory pathway TrbL component
MMRRALVVLAAVGCVATAPAVAQDPASTPTPAAENARAQGAPAAAAGPRVDPGFRSYQPELARQQHSLASAAAADRTVITISTLGLVLLGVLLILLLA